MKLKLLIKAFALTRSSLDDALNFLTEVELDTTSEETFEVCEQIREELVNQALWEKPSRSSTRRKKVRPRGKKNGCDGTN